MRNGFVMKENFLFVSERDRAEDCSLEIEKELFRIGESRKKAGRLGDTGRCRCVYKTSSSCLLLVIQGVSILSSRRLK